MINTTILLIVAVFIIALVFQKKYPIIVCPVCLAFSVAWAIGLIWYFFVPEIQIDPLLIGILMGGSAVGLMYFLASKLPGTYQAFKLPFLLTLVFIAYHILRGIESVNKYEVIIIAGIWAFVFLINLFKSNKSAGGVLKKLIECCKNW